MIESLDINALMVWRAVERLANVLIGGASIYLGYRLFMSLKERTEEGEAKLFLPGDVSVYVSRVGPGVFFAMFGAGIILMSFISAIELEGQVGAAPTTGMSASAGQPVEAAPVQHAAVLSYVSGEVDAAAFSADRASMQRDLLALRKLEGALSTHLADGGALALGSADAGTLLNALQRVKRLMLLSAWDPAWGDAEAFARWVQEGAFEPPPAGLEAAAMLFRGSPGGETP